MASNALCTVRDPKDPDFFATRAIISGIDSYSDITVAHRDIAYDIRPVCETVHTGAGEATYKEEGLVDIVELMDSTPTARSRPSSPKHRNTSRPPPTCFLESNR